MRPSLQGDDGKASDGHGTRGRGEQQWGNKNKEEGHNVVCSLSFLREHNGANDGNNGGGGKGMEAFSMHAAWLPVRVGHGSGRVFTRLSRVVRQDGDDDDGCNIRGRGELATMLLVASLF